MLATALRGILARAMNTVKYQGLVRMARRLMAKSRDPIHDLSHAERVVHHAINIARDMNIGQRDIMALELAAWWHDAARVLTGKPSIVWMSLIDDALSALLLWAATVRYGMLGSTAGVACRIILCKNMGTRKLFTRIFLRKRTRVLLDILADADRLDGLNIMRIVYVCRLAENSRVYSYAYRAVIWFHLNSNYLKLKTDSARIYLREILRQFVEWIERADIRAWHIAHFGIEWAHRSAARLQTLLIELQSPLRVTSVRK